MHYCFSTASVLLLWGVVILNFCSSQKLLSEQEMSEQFVRQRNTYSLPDAEKRHTCAFLSLHGNMYTNNKRHDAYLECNCARRVSDCQGSPLAIKRKCCPGFKAFLDEGSEEFCMERVLPRQTFKQAIIDMQAASISAAIFDVAYGAAFNDSSETYTLFIVRDADSQITPGMIRQSQNDSNASRKACKTTNTEPQPTKRTKVNEKSLEGKKLRLGLLTPECSKEENESSSFTSPILVHVAKGRVYTHLLNHESSIETVHSKGKKNTKVKFTRYSNGIMCVECSLIKEANHEAANGVIHVVDKPFLNSATQDSLATILKKDFAYFWSSLSNELKALLKSNSCGGWFTVFVPNQVVWSGDNAVTASNHVIKGLWCTQALVSQSTDNLATMAEDVIQFGCSGANREAIFVTSNGRNAQIDGTERGRTFDRMASNGVIHLINGKLESRAGLSFKFATQLDDAKVGTEQYESLQSQLTLCGIELLSDKKYIVLIPSRAAMKKFLAMPRTKNDAKLYIQSEQYRCQILRYHILIAEDGLTDLGSVLHKQKIYATMLAKNQIVSNFVKIFQNKVTLYFMSANSIGKLAFTNGHIYRINQLLLPPSSQYWSSLLTNKRLLPAILHKSLPTRLRNLGIMEAAAPLNTKCTHFVPPERHVSSDLLVKHSTKYLVWSKYLRIGDALELPPCNETTVGDNLILRRISRKRFTLGFINSRVQVVVQAWDILRASSMIWFIESSLISMDRSAKS